MNTSNGMTNAPSALSPEESLASEESALTAEYIDRLHAHSVELNERIAHVEHVRAIVANAYQVTLDALQLRRSVIVAALEAADGDQPRADRKEPHDDGDQAQAPQYGLGRMPTGVAR